MFPLLLYHEVSFGMKFKTWVCFLLLPIVVKNYKSSLAGSEMTPGLVGSTPMNYSWD